MKQLYWIDDDIEQVGYILQGAISKFWKLDNIKTEGIASKVFMFGNASDVADTDELPTSEDEKKAFQKFFDLFKDLCMEKDGPSEEREVFQKRKELIQDPVCYLYKSENPKERNEYLDLKSAWIGKEWDKEDEDSKNKAKKYAQKLIDKMDIKPGGVVGIDIALLYDDFHRLKDDNCILSMELCNQILGRNIKCFMYSSEAEEYRLREKWYEVYKKNYPHADANIQIYQRSDFMQKGDPVIVNKIEQMFENAGTEDEGEQDGKDVVGKEVGTIKTSEEKGDAGMAK